ncbi:hypothetical protein CMV_009409 [Castanea mollissima]|uniref:Uncharacterized protein n=1 Tax=Castanea mollissima TaxID=60419 RepID=A0A8J4VN08_9ROSI|nr:hypothetical protein CMV_009409 [Castanea mollissima]
MVNHGLERRFGSVMWIEIDVDGDQFCGLTEIGGLERHCGACDGYGVDGVLALKLSLTGSISVLTQQKHLFFFNHTQQPETHNQSTNPSKPKDPQQNQQTQAPDKCRDCGSDVESELRVGLGGPWRYRVRNGVVLPCPLRRSSQCGFAWVEVSGTKKRRGSDLAVWKPTDLCGLRFR